MKILVGLLLFATLSVSVSAKNTEGGWNWYYAAFYSPSIGSKVLLRSGTATVRISKAAVFLQFTEEDHTDMQASFSGQISDAGNVRGALKDFFPSGTDNFSGSYRQRKIDSCHWQELILRPAVPDGSALVISRIEGACQ